MRKPKTQFVALSGTGWAKHARYAPSCEKHKEYCKRTMLAYMPCPGLEGTSYIVKAVTEHFEDCWPLALWKFVMDPKQRWCPTWIVRNYEVLNNVIHGLPQLSAQPAPCPTSATVDPDKNALERLPHAAAFNAKFNFAPDTRSGEPKADEPVDADNPAETLA